MTAEAPAAPRVSWVRRGLWWAADYLYAGRRQLAVLAMPWSIGRPRPVPGAWHRGDDVLPEIVLLPGVYEHWTFLKPLGHALSRAGHRVTVVHGLGVNRRSIAETSARLAAVLAADPAPIAGRVLVAHSKGGLIGKHLIVAVETAQREGATDAPPLGLIGLVAVATPFGGSRLARLFFVPSIRAFDPGDETIVALGRETSINARIVSIFGPYDPHIPEGSALDGATNVLVPAPGHFRVLASPRTQQAVVEGVALLAERAAS